MIRKFTPYIYLLFFIVFSDGVFGQKIKLKIVSKDSVENRFLHAFEYQKKHKTKTSLYTEINTISNRLKQLGFFTNTHRILSEKDTLIRTQFSLGTKTEKASITISSTFKIQDPRFEIQNNILTIPIEQLHVFLTSITKNLEKKGKSFSEVKLTHIKTKKNTLFADLEIRPSKKRTIDRIIIKGYKNFPKSYNKYHFKKKNSVFNQQTLKNISSAIKSFDFASEIKPPEILFSKDSTLLYIYLKKESVHSFDGLLNFASKENGNGLLLNGHVNFKVMNLLNSGEHFKFYWNRVNDDSQELKITTKIPYFLGSRFSPEVSFLIYKQDSSFTNAQFKGKIFYDINSKAKIALTYATESSTELLQNNSNNQIAAFSNSFIGMQFTYQRKKNDSFNHNKLYFSINPSIGKRNSNEITTPQFKIDVESSYIWDINARNSIFVRNETGFINSNTLLENEIYRIGGFSSIRGFDEQSIFTSQYSFFNLEYRYVTATNSYLYSITDFGTIKTITSSNLLGIGIGYLFKIKNTQLNIGYVVSKTSTSNFNVNNSKFLLKIVNYF